jgi:hypothetical protein
MTRMRLAGVVVLGTLLTMVGTAVASGGTEVCVPSREGKPILTPRAGACRAGYTLTELGAEGKEGKPGPEGKNEFTAEEITLLKNLLPHIKYVTNGVGGKPTIQFSAVNVQVVSGEGKTNAVVNGEGNLVIGYDENTGGHQQTGSHNLVLGIEQTFTSFGGIVAGLDNTTKGQFASVTGGKENNASGKFATVSGGRGNRATEDEKWIGGGEGNEANEAGSSVSGGLENSADGLGSSVSGGLENIALGTASWVGGGRGNDAEGLASSIFGGKGFEAKNEYEAIP